jgi:serine/threonine protein kinase
MSESDDRFELLGELGRGGMAAVHLARDRRTGECNAATKQGNQYERCQHTQR